MLKIFASRAIHFFGNLFIAQPQISWVIKNTVMVHERAVHIVNMVQHCNIGPVLV